MFIKFFVGFQGFGEDFLAGQHRGWPAAVEIYFPEVHHFDEVCIDLVRFWQGLHIEDLII